MIDIHQHLIYGVDDGSRDLEMSLAMARMAAADGVTRIVCTPHSSAAYPFQTDVVNERLAELREALHGEIELSLACDFHITQENVAEAIANPFRYSIDGKRYLLIEFPNLNLSPGTHRVMFELQTAGYRLIVTHPERYPFVHRNPHFIGQWLEQGCMMQVTAGALIGKFGPQCETLAKELLDRNWIHFIATDAHNPDRRPPNLKAAFDYVAKRSGLETARRLCVVNPQAAVEGKPLGAQPEPVGLWDGIPLKFRLPGYKPPRSRTPGLPAELDSSPLGKLKRFFRN
jgi:protein-tyrosine phosphatase